jgi:Mg2+/Co2+ transporter CorC
VQDKEEAEIGGVCKGKMQRRGNFPLRCKKIDLEDLHFTVRSLEPRGMPAGVCA